jgi:DNA-binding MarR family transcriptional regulator
MDMTGYHPTLWRTSRVLANEKRLVCLRTVLDEPGLTVGETAGRVRLPVNHVGESLRALQARGLIVAQRHSKWVRYHPVPDPLVPNAAPLLNALKNAFAVGEKTIDVYRLLTGFTHPRRLIVLWFLTGHGPSSAEIIAQQTDISPQALFRHLKKLQARGLVEHKDDLWSVSRSLAPLPQALVALAIA